MDPRERMLRLLGLLQTGRRWPAADLARAIEVSPRTLRRDLDHLREIGYPVESTRGPAGSYRLVSGRALPPLILDDEEAVATMLGLTLAAAGSAGPGIDTDVAARAQAKLERVLPDRVRHRTAALLTAMEVAAAGAADDRPHPLLPIADAIVGRRRLAFAYPRSAGAVSREVEPARLVHLQRRWYLFAWDTGRADWRTFRLDRIDGAPEPRGVFLPRPLPAEDLASHLRERFRGAPERRVSLLLRASAEEAASRLHRVDGALAPLADGACRYTAFVDSFEWLGMVLLLSDLEFTVESPPEFSDYLARHAARWLRAGQAPRPRGPRSTGEPST